MKIRVSLPTILLVLSALLFPALLLPELLSDLFVPPSAHGETLPGQAAEVKGVSTADPFFGNLKVFAGPSQQSTVKGFVSNGDAVRLMETSGNLARITCGKFPEGGWVWASYIKPTEEEEPEDIPGGITLPQLLKKDVPPPTGDFAGRMRLMLPRASADLVASFIRLISPPAP